MLASLAYALFGIVAFAVTVKLFLPAMNPAGTWAYSLDGSATGAGTAMAGATAAREVPSLWQILAVPSVKIVTLAVLLAGAGVVGARSPWFALVLPTLAWRFAGSVDAYYQWSSWHYNAVLVPIAACALLDVIAGWLAPADLPAGLATAGETDADCANPAPASSGRRRALVWAAACVPAISLALTATSLPLWKLATLTDSPRLDAAQGVIDAVPAGASVETDTTLLARLVPGRDVYWVGTTVGMDAPPEYVVVDRQSYAWGGAEVDAESWASAAHPGHTYATIYSAQGFRVARRTS